MLIISFAAPCDPLAVSRVRACPPFLLIFWATDCETVLRPPRQRHLPVRHLEGIYHAAVYLLRPEGPQHSPKPRIGQALRTQRERSSVHLRQLRMVALRRDGERF